MTHLTLLDYVLLLVYLAATLALGLYIGRRVKTGEDYFLAGRSLPWWAIGMSLVATDIGGTDIIGVGGAAYTHGLAVGNFEWIGCVPAMIIAAFVFIPFFWRLGIYTIPEYLERRFNVGVRSALAVCWLIFMACNLGVMLLASAKMMHELLGWNVTACILATALMVGIYTVAGGLAAVVYTDMIQCVVMIVGCLVVLVIGLVDIGGISALREALQPEQTSLIVPADSESPFVWPGILIGLGMILSPAYWIGNQAIVQRSFGAKSEFEAKAAYIWGALLKNVIPVIIVVPGLIAVVKFPELKDGDAAFPTLVSTLLPTGLRGIFLAAFIAALMSSIDSYLNSASVIATIDFYRRFYKPDADQQSLLRVGRTVTFALVIWAILFALFLRGSGGIYAIFQTMMSFFQGPALAVLLTGLLWRRATGVAALIGFLVGVCAAISLYAMTQERVLAMFELEPLFQIQEPFLYFSIWAFLTSLILIIGISLISRPEPEEKMKFVVGGRRKVPAG